MAEAKNRDGDTSRPQNDKATNKATGDGGAKTAGAGRRDATKAARRATKGAAADAAPALDGGSADAAPSPAKGRKSAAAKPSGAKPADSGADRSRSADRNEAGAAAAPPVAGSGTDGSGPGEGTPASAATPVADGAAPTPVVTRDQRAGAPCRPAEPKADWSPGRKDREAAGAAAVGPGGGALRAALLGAAGGVLAALAVTALFYPAPQGSDDRDGKVATALEELEKQRAEAASRAAEPDRIAALSARIDALEQKLAAAPQPAEGDDRLKAIEQKLAELEKQRGAPAGQQADSRSNSESIAAINRKLEALEQRVASLAPRGAGASAPAATSAPAASRAPAPVPPRPQPYPRPGYGPEDDGVAMLPPAAVPEPPGAAPAVPVRGWVLHNVTGGVAVLEGRGSGLVEARRGQYVRGLGRILGISRRGDLWVVTTESGVITAPVY